jgi:hypothetical protein
MPRVGNLATGLAGAALLLPVELQALHARDPAIIWVVATLFAVMGLAIGLTIAAAEALVARLGAGPIAASLVRAAGSLLATLPLLRHLFDGGFAATLPGARWGHLWVPMLGWLIVAGALWAGARLLSPRACAVALWLSAIALHLIHRRLYPKGYGDLHLLLTVGAAVAAGLAVRLGANGPAAAPRTRAVTAIAITAAILASFALTLRYGLASRDERRAIVEHFTATRQMVRLAREAFDRDGDGYSAVLGGPDCDDGNPRVHPLAIELPGDPVDENCDGVLASAPPPAPSRTPQDLWRESPGGAAALARPRGFDVLLVCVDALRAGLLADTPEARRDFPHTFALLDESHVYRRAFATSASTYVSLPSIVTGRLNPFEGIHATLGDLMRASGRATHAVYPREVLRWVGEVTITHGLDGFDRLINDPGHEDRGSASTSSETTELGLKFLDGVAAQPSYLLLHYFDVHEHNEIEETDPRLAAISGGRKLDRFAKYRALFGVVDREIGRLVGELRRRHRWERTIVVFVADHGEGLAEEPRLPDEHNEYVYNVLVHVPLAIRIPGISGGYDDEPVSIADILPTLADLVGQKIPEGTDGVSLAPSLLGGPRSGPRPLFITDTQQYAVIAWPWKLLVWPTENLVELYDLAADFGEHHDLSSAQPERVAELERLYPTTAPLQLDQSAEGRRRRDERARAQLGR